MDCNEPSLLRLSPRLLRPWFVISSQLFTSQQTHLTRIAYDSKLRWMDCKDMSPLRPSLRLLKP